MDFLTSITGFLSPEERMGIFYLFLKFSNFLKPKLSFVWKLIRKLAYCVCCAIYRVYITLYVIIKCWKKVC